MSSGDHIYVRDSLYGIPFEHHGIDMGDGTVIHLSPTEGPRFAFHDSSERFCVRQESMQTFCGGRPIFMRSHPSCLPAERVTEAAKSYLGKSGYSLLDGNCEHFANLCSSGEARSHQVEMAEATLSSMASMSVKVICSATSRVGSKFLLKGATRMHPAMLMADGIEVLSLGMSCRSGLSPERAKVVARVSGGLAALGIGGLLGGPGGAMLGLAAHSSTTALGDRLGQTLKRLTGLTCRNS